MRLHRLSPDLRMGYLIEFILTKRKDIGDVCNVLGSAECDYTLVREKFKLCIRMIRMNGLKFPKTS